MTREEWLIKAIEMIDEEIFNGNLGSKETKYQVSVGWTKSSKALGETIYPYDGEDVTLDDFFPVTIHVRCDIKDPIKILGVLVHECIHAFMNIKGHGKDFKHEALQVGFEKPVTQYNPNSTLISTLENIYKKLGEFPGKAIYIHKEEKEKKSNTVKFFCPECNFEVKTNKKMFEQHGQGIPTCPCGAKMGIAIDENENTED